MSTHNRRGGGRGRGGRKNRGDWKDHQQRSDKEAPAVAADESPIVQTFRLFQAELDSRNDRFERIVKLSRDITIESKRIIFLLQRAIGADDPDKVFKEAHEKIQEINATKFLEIAKELDGQDPYQFLRAYTNGLQEYIEAVTFYYYLTEQHLVNLDKVQTPLVFSVSVSDTVDEKSGDSDIPSVATETTTPIPVATETTTPTPVSKETTSADDQSSTECSSKVAPSSDPAMDIDAVNPDPKSSPADPISSPGVKQLTVHIPASEYMMGVADFTGELMRMAITSVGTGDLDTPKVVAGMMRIIHNAFSVFDHIPRGMRQKATVLRQSLRKVETACYALTVRGSEIPKHMLTDVFSSASLGGDNYTPDDGEDVYD